MVNNSASTSNVVSKKLSFHMNKVNAFVGVKTESLHVGVKTEFVWAEFAASNSVDVDSVRETSCVNPRVKTEHVHANFATSNCWVLTIISRATQPKADPI